MKSNITLYMHDNDTLNVMTGPSSYQLSWHTTDYGTCVLVNGLKYAK